MLMKKNIVMMVMAAALLSAFLISCANQSAPGGGPVDTTPPEIILSTHENGQTNVNPRVSIDIRFSKWINIASLANVVSIYPVLPKSFAIRASKNRISIIPVEPLEDNTTYHLVLSTSLKDLRGNAITEPISIVFSTGPELDRGQLSGSIRSLEPLTVPPKVALYWAGDGWNDLWYYYPPRYIVRGDSAGVFSFSHLREGPYRIVAFNDKYRRNRLFPGDVSFTSLQQTINVTSAAQTVRLFPTDSDTAEVKPVVYEPEEEAPDTVAAVVEKAPDAIFEMTFAEPQVMIDQAVRDSLDAIVIPNDTTCYRLNGGADCLEPNERRKWTFSPIGRDETFTVRDSAGTFTFRMIPSSKGTLKWFIDDNDDDKVTIGKLIPWRAPEEFFLVPGILDARGRWEIDGWQVNACE
ncbi:MAG: Ig-like domain-containing protein [Chitinispirillales bacterium]|jgi:hypothetical protein|nr:Ig-like domain-containing protein [Chitinispirillales bacterium]